MPDPSQALSISRNDHGWTLAGEIDAHTAPLLVEEFTRGDVPLDADGFVVIEMGDVTFVDSSGLRALVALDGRLGDGTVKLRDPIPSVRRLLTITGLDTTFAVDES